MTRWESERHENLRRAATDPGPTDEVTTISFDERLHALRTGAREAVDGDERWRLLLDAVVGMADLRLDALLARIVELAAGLVDAHYAALGVLDDDGARRFGRFISLGMDSGEVQHIGAPPEGRGLLGVLVEQPGPLRLHDLRTHGAAYGFPPGHAEMRSFLGVPVRIRDRVFGNLYLTEKADGADFTEEDEVLVTALAGAAGTAIENARFHEDAARRERWLMAAVDLTRLVLEPDSATDALQIVADQVRALAGADVAWVVEVEDGRFSLAVVSGMPVSREALAGVDMSRSLAREVVETGIPVAIDDLASDPRALDVGLRLGWDSLGKAVMVPLGGDDGVEGVVALAWRRGSDAAADTDPSLPTLFAQQAILALHAARARREQERLAVLEDRDRIARDLHDLVIQRLFAIGMGLQGVSNLHDPTEVSKRLDRAVHDLDDRIRDIRQTVFALGVPESSHDVRVGVADVVDRVSEALAFRPDVRFVGPLGYRVGPDLVPDVLAVLTEALSNVARHAGASSCEVELSVTDGLRLTVRDDGCGITADVVESGLANMRRRAEARGGSFAARPRDGPGTVLTWSVPLD